jgi:hypothetical protein
MVSLESFALFLQEYFQAARALVIQLDSSDAQTSGL